VLTLRRSGRCVEWGDLTVGPSRAGVSGGEEDPVQQEVLNYPQGSEGGQVSCLGDECDGS
jgi:hypothetical protein